MLMRANELNGHCNLEVEISRWVIVDVRGRKEFRSIAEGEGLWELLS